MVTMTKGGRRSRNSDGDAFVEGEPVVYGPLVESPRYMLAWSLETTPACNGPRDTRPEDRRGALRARLETGEDVDLDCDNFSPIRRIAIDDEAMSRIVSEASPALQKELCRDYIADDFSPGVCGRAENSDTAAAKRRAMRG
jgi:hypothetical protein